MRQWGELKEFYFSLIFSYFETEKIFGKFYAVLKQNLHHHKKISLNPTPPLIDASPNDAV
jgi:hypothetical protein